VTDVSALFEPFHIKSLSLKNRIVMAPMTRSSAPGGVPGETNAAYYRRVENDVGLILSEGAVIDRPAARNEAGIPFFHGEAALVGWQHVIEEVHAAGGKMGPQIWHVGAMPGQRGWEPDEPVETPSGLVAPGQPRGVAMSEVVRPAIEADDLLRAVATLCHGAHGEEPAYARKMVELLVDGLRYGAGTRIDTPRNRRR
jgi:2,4-dienoyl-CoA reductase-like NADH-dependent reductase (Old Yellow Enzyme family)